MSERSALVELTRVRFLEFLREPEAIFWVFAFPILLTFALGLAFRSQGAPIVPVAIAAGAGADEARAALEDAGGFTVRVLAEPELSVALRNGAVQLVVTPAGEGGAPEYRFDPTRPESRLARLAVDSALQRARGRQDVFTARSREETAPGSRYVDWLVPGLVGLNIMGTGIWSIGFAIVQARTRKLLKRLLATPMRRWEYLASLVLARLVFLLLEVAAIVGVTWLAFGIPVNGSLVLLGAVSLVGALAFGGLGILLACRAQTVEAVSGLMNVAMLPMWLFSGVFFSSENFPRAMQPFIQALPLTALNDALRAVMIDGAGLGGVWVELLNMTAWTVVTFWVGLRLFRWR